MTAQYELAQSLQLAAFTFANFFGFFPAPPLSPSLSLSVFRSADFCICLAHFTQIYMHVHVCVSVLLASYFHICFKSIYRKLTVKYAKLARSQISATVSGYNCGKSARRGARGQGVGGGGKCCRRFSVLCLCLHVIAVCLFA